jgi:hypothetical protein
MIGVFFGNDEVGLLSITFELLSVVHRNFPETISSQPPSRKLTVVHTGSQTPRVGPARRNILR